MNILTLQGGARKKGNTATILSWVEDEVKTKAVEFARKIGDTYGKEYSHKVIITW